jgi:diacylglycerol kinase (ATP)
MVSVSEEGPVKIVVTPGSGEGRAMRTAQRLHRALARRGREASIESFSDLAGLTEWARTCTREFAVIVCMGGDATMSAASTAAMRLDVPFVPVPNGFGNIFAGVFGHPQKVRGVLRLLNNGELHRVDVGMATAGSTEEVFLSHRSYGFLEQIQEIAEHGRRQPKRRLLRLLWYVRVAGAFLFTERLASFALEIDGKPVTDDAVLVTVANVETYRGFLALTPTASPIDGLFDVCVIPRVPTVILMFRLLRVMLHVPGRWRGVALYRGRRATVTTPRRREELDVRRHALPLLVPPGTIEKLRSRIVEDAPPISTP